MCGQAVRRLEIIVEDMVVEAGPVVRPTTRPVRALSIIAALALLFGGVALAQSADSGGPKTHVVTNVDHGKAVVDGAGAVLGRTLGFGAVQPQINVPDLIRAIVCPILASLLSGPFGGFIAPVINSLRVAFGCVSG